MSEQKALKRFPTYETDAEAEAFVEKANLADYDFAEFRPVHFEFHQKAAQINMRVPSALLDAVKDIAKARGVPYTRYIRELLERDIARLSKR